MEDSEERTGKNVRAADMKRRWRAGEKEEGQKHCKGCAGGVILQNQTKDSLFVYVQGIRTYVSGITTPCQRGFADHS